MLAMFLGAVLLAAAPLDAAHAAVLATVSADPMAAGCAPGELRKAVADTELIPLGRLGSDKVILFSVHARCICGEHNCQQLAIRYGSGAPRVLLAGLGWRADPRPAKPLPQIVVRSRWSAAVSDVTTYAYRGGKYVQIKTERVRNES
jgi:hypothetical protein